MHIIKTWKVWKSMKKEEKITHHPITYKRLLLTLWYTSFWAIFKTPKQLHSLYVDLCLSSALAPPEAQKSFECECEELSPLGRVKACVDGFLLFSALQVGKSKSFRQRIVFYF